MPDRIYLDAAAAMPVSPDAADKFREYALRFRANPESLHSEGVETAEALKAAKIAVAEALTGDSSYSLFWASSATEAIKTFFGFPYFINKIVCVTDAEHPAVREAVKNAGFREIRRIPLQPDGTVRQDGLEEILTPDVSAVIVHCVQNETGAIQNLAEIREIINRKAPDALLISDTVQAIGKIAVPWSEAEINAGFIGGHKIGAPSGGALLCRFHPLLKNKFTDYMRTLRSVRHLIGRPDPAVCLTLADTAVSAESSACLCRVVPLCRLLREELAKFAESKGLEIIFPIPEASASPYILTFLMPPYQGEIMVRMLSDKNVMVSSGSACEASKKAPDSSLTAIGISANLARTALRVSFTFNSSEKDVFRFVEALGDAIDDY